MASFPDVLKRNAFSTGVAWQHTLKSRQNVWAAPKRKVFQKELIFAVTSEATRNLKERDFKAKVPEIMEKQLRQGYWTQTDSETYYPTMGPDILTGMGMWKN